MPLNDERTAADRGSRSYTKLVLAAYDRFVLGFSNTWVWHCPTPVLLQHYAAHVSGRHLDIGVGTGFFLDHCPFPTATPAITLLDLNPNSLQVTRTRIARYRPAACLANVLAPPPLAAAQFDSIGINYVLHCLPGTMESKGTVFRALKPLLSEGGVLFGATLLGRGVPRSPLARGFLRTYNALGTFSNTQDDAEQLRAILDATFRSSTLEIVGCAALFAGHS